MGLVTRRAFGVWFFVAWFCEGATQRLIIEPDLTAKVNWFKIV